MPNANSSRRTRPPPTHHRIPVRDRQQYCPRLPHFQNATETFKIFRHALLVDERPNQPEPIRYHLGPRRVQVGRLLHQASPTMASSQHALQAPTTSQDHAHSTTNKSMREGVFVVPRPTWHGNSGTQSTLSTIQNRFPSRLCWNPDT